MSALLLLVALLMPARPTAKLVVHCAGLQCTFDGSSSLRATQWSFDFGTGQALETRPKVTNTFAPGTWCVKLTVRDAAGGSSYATKLLTLPATGSTFPACPAKAPAPAKIDTVVRVDTVRVPSPPVHDTTVVQLPPIHDTTVVQLPARVDTVTITHTDTISTALPVLPLGVTVVNDFGDIVVRWNTQVLGRLVIRTDGKVEAYRFNPAVTFGEMGLKTQGAYPTQVEAIAALMRPAPPGFVWTP